MKFFKKTYIIFAATIIASPAFAQSSDHAANTHNLAAGTTSGGRDLHNHFQAHRSIQNSGEVRSSKPAEAAQSGHQYASHPDINPYDRSQVERLQVDMHLDN